MLILMITFTTAGLWILSLPIGAGQVIDPLPVGSVLPPARAIGNATGGSGMPHPMMTRLCVKELNPGKERRGSASRLLMPALDATS